MVASGVAQQFDLFILTCLRIVLWRAMIGRIPLGEWSARRRDLYLTTHNTHNRQTDKHSCPGGIRTHNLSRRAAEDLRLRPRGHNIFGAMTHFILCVCYNMYLSTILPWRSTWCIRWIRMTNYFLYYRRGRNTNISSVFYTCLCSPTVALIN